VTNISVASRSARTGHSLFRRDVLLGLGAFCLGSLGASCASQQQTGSDVRNNDVAMSASSGEEVQALRRLERAGVRLFGSQQDDVKWEYGIVSGPSLIAMFTAENSFMASLPLLQLCENDGQIAALLVFRDPSIRFSSQGVSAQDTLPPLNAAPTRPGTAELITKTDVNAIRALARAGYDPRDAMVLWQRIGRVGGDGVLPHATRLAAMAAELHKLGYQV
jgi:hypothetical protein